jgi:hypothetical protein
MMTLLRMAFPFLFKVKEKELIVTEPSQLSDTIKSNTKAEQIIVPEKPKHKYHVNLDVIIGKNDTSNLKWCTVEITADGQRLENKKELATDTSINLLLDDILMAVYDVRFSFDHSKVRSRIGAKMNLYMSSEEFIPYKSDKICITVNIIKR